MSPSNYTLYLKPYNTIHLIPYTFTLVNRIPFTPYLYPYTPYIYTLTLVTLTHYTIILAYHTPYTFKLVTPYSQYLKPFNSRIHYLSTYIFLLLFTTNYVSFLFPLEPITLEYMQENFVGGEEVRSIIMQLQSGIDERLEKFEHNIEKRLAEMENDIIKKCREDYLDKLRSMKQTMPETIREE